MGRRDYARCPHGELIGGPLPAPAHTCALCAEVEADRLARRARLLAAPGPPGQLRLELPVSARDL